MLVRIIRSEGPESTWKESVSPSPQPSLTGVFFRGAGTWSSCSVWMCMCMWDHLMLLFKDPGEKIWAGWSSPLSHVMYPPSQWIVWYCKRINSTLPKQGTQSSQHFQLKLMDICTYFTRWLIHTNLYDLTRIKIHMIFAKSYVFYEFPQFMWICTNYLPLTPPLNLPLIGV